MKKDKTIFVIRRMKPKKVRHANTAWKIAYADFVTAMMAFFLLMWLLNVVNVNTLQGLSRYFSPVNKKSFSGAGGIFGGSTDGPQGLVTLPNLVEQPHRLLRHEPESTQRHQGQSLENTSPPTLGPQTDVNTMKKLLQQAIKRLPIELRFLKKTIVLQEEKKGLHIQLTLKNHKPLFFPRTVRLTREGKLLIHLVARRIQRTRAPLILTQYVPHHPNNTRNKNNWFLGAARVDALHQAFLREGVLGERFHALQLKNSFKGEWKVDLLLVRTPHKKKDKIKVLIFKGGKKGS